MRTTSRANRYLFLDIDGVLNSERTVNAFNALTHAGRVKHDMLTGKQIELMWDSVAVGLLRAAQEAIGFKIVISSTWRKTFSVQDFHTIFDAYGWDTRGIIIGKTGDEAVIRGKQIKSWLDARAEYPYTYAILDDDADMMPTQKPCFVQTSFRNGLSYENFVELFAIFGVEYKNVGSIL